MTKKYAELPASRLSATLDAQKIPCETSDGLPRKTNGARLSPQPRALKALELGLHIRHQGYNIYLSGENNLKDKADFTTYTETVPNPLPKFKFRKVLINEFKNNLIENISPLLD